MTTTAVETSHPAETTDQAENGLSEEKHEAQHLQGWALASLTVAFMCIGFVLALDNTILGSWLSLGV